MYSSVGNLGCFYLLTIVNHAAMNMYIQTSHLDSACNSFGYILRNGNPRLYGSSIFIFCRKCHTVFLAIAPVYSLTKVPRASSHPLQLAILLGDIYISSEYIYIYSHLNGCEVLSHCGLDLYFVLSQILKSPLVIFSSKEQSHSIKHDKQNNTPFPTKRP